jgi:sulfite reductase (ferredoxin)
MQAALVLLACLSGAAGFRAPGQGGWKSSRVVRMNDGSASASGSEGTSLLTSTKKLGKVEVIKVNSNYLREPLKTELGNDEIFVGADAVVVLKYHGSYMQDDRDKRTKGAEKDYQFMLRLKMPCGEVPPALYKELDVLSDKYGQNDLRATTRQAYQIHGILKGDLKTVISTIMNAGSSTVGACGDVSRNVMCSPAPFTSKEYAYARQYSKVMAELFKPLSTAFTEIWEPEGEKVAKMEYWAKDLKDAGFDIKSAMLKDTGTGIITKDTTEPLYGSRYLPRKFKIAVTVPGDNSVDIYTNDIGLVVITDPASGELLGFNVMVGGGMGRTHMKDTTFARTADHLGFVSKDDVMELCKSILATQRDHGNRDVRPNARMKYLVHEKGVDAFRSLVEVRFPFPLQLFLLCRSSHLDTFPAHPMTTADLLWQKN